MSHAVPKQSVQSVAEAVIARARINPKPDRVLPKYRIEDFRHPAHDEMGISVPVSARVDKRIATAVQEIVHGHILPYRTPGDLMRDALIRHLHFLAKLEPGEFTGMVTDIDMAMDVVKMHDAILGMAKMVRSAEMVINGLVGEGMEQVATKLVYQLRKRAAHFSDVNLRRRFLGELDRKFSHLLSAAPGDGLPALVEVRDGEEREDEHEHGDEHDEHHDSDTDAGWSWGDEEAGEIASMVMGSTRSDFSGPIDPSAVMDGIDDLTGGEESDGAFDID